MASFSSAEELIAAQGTPLAVTGWLEITQDRVNLFADATDDHQWIHVDLDRAAAGPFGGPIAHGYLSLSLLAAFSPEIITIVGHRMTINYGLDRVRFLTPVRVGARIRDRAELLTAVPTDGGTRLTIRHIVEIEDAPKPALIADSITLLVW